MKVGTCGEQLSHNGFLVFSRRNIKRCEPFFIPSFYVGTITQQQFDSLFASISSRKVKSGDPITSLSVDFSAMVQQMLNNGSMVSFCCEVEWCTVVHIYGMDVCPVLKQEQRSLLRIHHGRIVEWCAIVGASSLRVRTIGQQDSHNFSGLLPDNRIS